jgi:hypothetical protein
MVPTFNSVHSLYILATLELSIEAALQGLTEESSAEVFHSLRSFFIVGNMLDNKAYNHSSQPVNTVAAL